MVNMLLIFHTRAIFHRPLQNKWSGRGFIVVALTPGGHDPDGRNTLLDESLKKKQLKTKTRSNV